ncbi:c6 zinc finger domain containing protein [Anopheles sinensis]|uniref:C6 zinc finger domain containing protein n=1 Tax=Anopheles sinensis TaxID=74873 RepID=A0A084W2U3_ANOSI|nr:c6 zinc finger domain containing protein [Anopheles sinensis]
MDGPTTEATVSDRDRTGQGKRTERGQPEADTSRHPHHDTPRRTVFKKGCGIRARSQIETATETTPESGRTARQCGGGTKEKNNR